MKQKLFLWCFALLCSANIFAHDFEVNGIYYNKLGGDSVEVTFQGSSAGEYNEYQGSVVIPDTIVYDGQTYVVTAIGNNALALYGSLLDVTIPKTIVRIADNAFYSAWGLQTLAVETGNPNYYSESNCLIEVATKRMIAGTNQSKIPSGVLSIANSVCWNLAIKDLYIPATVMSIGTNAFIDNPLESIEVEAGNQFYHSSGNCLIETSTNTLLIGCTNSIIPADGTVTAIASQSFAGSSMESIEIPEGVTSIGQWAFLDCYNLTSVSIPNSMTEIRDGAFQGCSQLEYKIYDNAKYLGNTENPYYAVMESTNKDITSCSIHDGTRLIADLAFYNCTALESVVIPNYVHAIGDNAFANCSSLTSVSIGKGITAIDYAAFQNCTQLTSITINAIIPPALEFYVFENIANGANITVPCESLTNYRSTYPWYSIPNVNAIFEYIFSIQSANEEQGMVNVTQQPDCVTDAIIEAMPTEGYQFVAWNDGNTENPRKVTVNCDTAFVATFEAQSTTPAETTHTYVDLGLPSGTLWATCNVGATSPEEYGDYFAWGETEPKEEYTQSTLKYWDNDANILTKYTGSDFSTLEAADDAATANWGSSWRMPTMTEQQELQTECVWTWTTYNGVNGYKVQGPNGNTIFLPAAGSRYSFALSAAGTDAYYWSSSLHSDDFNRGYCLYFYSGGHSWDHNSRYYGRSVRPVYSTTPLVTGSVAYELNGGVTNDWGWTCPQDMYTTLNADWNAFAGTSTVWTPLAELTDFTKGIPTQAGTMTLDFLESEGFKSHFQWLIEYMDTKATEQEKTLPSTNASYLRYNLAAFFKNTQRSSWPVSPDYTSCGVSNYDAYKSHWKAAYANPTEPKEAFTLNAPYQEGKFFAGWFRNADFSGDKVTVIDSTFSGTLYAKWYDFPIVTIAEALALEDSTVCSVQGTVTFVAGNNLWMQDAQAAINVYQQNHGLQAGDKVVFKDAIKTVRYGIPQLSQADSIIIEGAGAIIPATVTIANLLADETNAYLNHYVHLEGLRATWDGEDLYFRENDNKVLVYNSGITAADLPERQKLDAYVIVSAYNGVIQFRTALDLVTKTGLPAQDNYAYPARGENGEYTLKNDWIFSNTLDNFQSNRPNGQALYVRGMVAKDGIMYFADREFSRLVRVDGATGIMLEPIKLADNLWTKTLQAQDGSDSIVSAAVTMKNNDIKCDDAGNLLLGPCSTNSGDFQVWKVNPETGAGELVIHEKLWDDAAKDSIEWRIDAFDVYGDVNSSAIIMAANANAMNVFKWTIEEGKQVGVAEVIDLYVDPSENSYLLNDGAMITNPGTAPQIYIVDDNYFYIDGFSTLATLFNMDGTLADDFKNCAAGLKVGNAENDTTLVQTQQNGVVEFQVGNEHFLFITAAGTTAHIGSPNTFALYKYQNDNRFFADLEPLWFFPNDGMGTATNGSRMAPVSVEVDQKTGTAHLYVYACENGYGRYTLQVEGAAQPEPALELHVKNLTMHPDEKYYLNTTVQPQDFDKSTLIWSSDNDEIASVENGLVTAHQTGTATITVTTPDSQLSSSCVVRIVNVGDDITYDVIINPSTESAEFSWPAIENASSYTFVIYADAEQTEKICTLTFDANGYLTRIDFMRTKSAATRDAHRGFQFVVTGLEPATTYGYALDSYTEQSTLIDRKIGEFTTTSSTTTALDNTAINESVTVQKVLENGTIYILKPNGEKYTVDGIRVE